jgi:superfamily I DNA/RNA helicase
MATAGAARGLGTLVLSREQRAVVEAPPDGPHLLVLAAPGSGKTRVIAERIRWLIESCGIDPTAIVAVTFTRRAADELRGRIGSGDVFAGTFHSLCTRILRDHGAEIGLRRPFRIVDEHDAFLALETAAARAGFPLPDDPKPRNRTLKELKRRISRRTLAGVEDAPPGRRDCLPEPLVRAVADAYLGVLAERNAVDFDGLLAGALRVLTAAPEPAADIAGGIRFLFVDEFHDVSGEQYELIRRLAPPRRPLTRVAVVADPHQAIYGWRGGDLGLLTEFRRSYRPRECRLAINFRSTPQIVDAARAVMTRADLGALATPNRPDYPVAGCGYADQDAEAAALVRLIEKARAAGYGYGQMAVLFRTHDRGNDAERALLAAGVPLWRIQPDRFFSRPEVREVLRYLELGVALHDDLFAGALNWPRVAVDELAMIDLRRLAEERGCSLCDIARGAFDANDRVSPLARRAVRDLLRLLDEALAPAIGAPIDEVIDRLLPGLASRRSPIPRAERPALLGLLEFLAGPLVEAAARLDQAIVAGRPVALRHDGTADAVAAAVILRTLIRDDLSHATVVLGQDVGTAGAFVVDLSGSADWPAGSPTDDAATLHIGPRRTRDYVYSASTVAWRLAQMVLIGRERLDGQTFALLDMETGSRLPAVAEPLDVAVVRWARGRERAGGFATHVRPRSGMRAIEATATDVHGITWSMVRDAPPPEAVLPPLLAAMGDLTVVGHNLEQFDYPILRRCARDTGLAPPRHLLLDTLPLARRLLPDAPSHRLGDLARDLLGEPGPQPHQARADALLVGRLLDHLLRLLRREQELDAMARALPLVAAGILAAGVPRHDENAVLLMAGRRARRFGQGEDLVNEWAALAPRAPALLHDLDQAAVPIVEDDADWRDLGNRWREVAADYRRTAADPRLPAFLHQAALAEAIDYVPRARSPIADTDAAADPRFVPLAERVAMMTVHSAKGKEWPVVFVVGAEAGQFPVDRADDPDEERRVLYVAMTRAARRLVLLWSGGRHAASPFFRDLPADLIDRR